MSRMKYQKDEKGRTILGEQYGIQITRPWNPVMYDHNAKVSEQMKSAIDKAIQENDHDEEALKVIGKAINAYGYGYGMELEEIHNDCIKGLSQMSDHWLHSDTWPDLLKAGFVKPINIAFVGYDKIQPTGNQ